MNKIAPGRTNNNLKPGFPNRNRGMAGIIHPNSEFQTLEIEVDDEVRRMLLR
jgi:hypothetical protein